MNISSEVAEGDLVVLMRTFENGAAEQKHKRKYPGGSPGVMLKRRDRYVSEVRMEDPPGETYAEKVIVVPHGDIRKSAHVSKL